MVESSIFSSFFLWVELVIVLLHLCDYIKPLKEQSAVSQIDGFEQEKRVVVIAATNRKQDLDPALIR